MQVEGVRAWIRSDGKAHKEIVMTTEGLLPWFLLLGCVYFIAETIDTIVYRLRGD